MEVNLNMKNATIKKILDMAFKETTDIVRPNRK